MGDTEFEEFQQYFEDLPQHIRATAKTYTLVHDIVLDDSPTSTSPKKSDEKFILPPCNRVNPNTDITVMSIGEKKKSSTHEKPRRKLPEIPKNTEAFGASLADEIGEALKDIASCDNPAEDRPLLMISYLRENLCSPDSGQFDSGNSTANSPDDSKCSSGIFLQVDPAITAISSMSCSAEPLTHLELLDATHRALHKFICRHTDELELEIGDPIYVQKEADDLWFEGINLRSGQHGVFPSAYVVDVEYNDFDGANAQQVKKERFLLNYIGSVETLFHKGNSVLFQAVHKVLSTQPKKYTCILEVSDQGLRMLDTVRLKKDPKTNSLDYFYSLKNVSFCAFLPHDQHYMGFITKHPHCDRFACHVFHSEHSTRPVAECIGRAFQRFYQKFIETAYPTEDIYIE